MNSWSERRMLEKIVVLSSPTYGLEHTVHTRWETKVINCCHLSAIMTVSWVSMLESGSTCGRQARSSPKGLFYRRSKGLDMLKEGSLRNSIYNPLMTRISLLQAIVPTGSRPSE